MIAVAPMLCIGTTTLRRREGKLFEPVPRQGRRKIRVFKPEQVEVLRESLREKTRLGAKPEFVGLEEVARRAARSMQTIRRRLGTELPPGPKLTQGPRARWGVHAEGGEADRGVGEAARPAEAAKGGGKVLGIADLIPDEAHGRRGTWRITVEFEPEPA
ncbi:hypothetical protein [Sorangium sp. So ce693]|uniref:hypothetical protein n=1 Tax=Sorangium sp. So ce693 TaxID=3133318 RepID=UPI003F60819E